MHEFEQAGYGPGPYVQLYVTESSDCGYTCDNCGQKGLRYKFHLRSGNGTEFGVGSECIKKADPDLWLAIKAETGIPGENVSAVMVKRKAIFDEAQPIRTRLIELGWPGGSGVKLFADIDNIKKKQVKTLEKELARMKVILTSAERSAQYRVRQLPCRKRSESVRPSQRPRGVSGMGNCKRRSAPLSIVQAVLTSTTCIWTSLCPLSVEADMPMTLTAGACTPWSSA
jgi:hypothetical protein